MQTRPSNPTSTTENTNIALRDLIWKKHAAACTKAGVPITNTHCIIPICIGYKDETYTVPQLDALIKSIEQQGYTYTLYLSNREKTEDEEKSPLELFNEKYKEVLDRIPEGNIVTKPTWRQTEQWATAVKLYEHYRDSDTKILEKINNMVAQDTEGYLKTHTDCTKEYSTEHVIGEAITCLSWMIPNAPSATKAINIMFYDHSITQIMRHLFQQSADKIGYLPGSLQQVRTAFVPITEPILSPATTRKPTDNPLEDRPATHDRTSPNSDGALSAEATPLHSPTLTPRSLPIACGVTAHRDIDNRPYRSTSSGRVSPSSSNTDSPPESSPPSTASLMMRATIETVWDKTVVKKEIENPGEEQIVDVGRFTDTIALLMFKLNQLERQQQLVSEQQQSEVNNTTTTTLTNKRTSVPHTPAKNNFNGRLFSATTTTNKNSNPQKTKTTSLENAPTVTVTNSAPQQPGTDIFRVFSNGANKEAKMDAQQSPLGQTPTLLRVVQ